MQGATFVRVDCRGFVLAAQARLVPLGEDRAFVALEAPSPVRSLLAIHGPQGDVRALEVTEVHEYPTSPTGERGCVGRFVEHSELHRAARVGTETLTRPQAEAQEPAEEGEPASESSLEPPPDDSDTTT